MNDDIGKRLKAYYEVIPKTKLMRRCPVAIRIDGKAFHTFTKGFKKPFDRILMESMQETMKYLCENIQGCVFGYTQSDEITLLLVDYQTLTTSAWFDYEVQKICSISASMATMAFNRIFTSKVLDWFRDNHFSGEDDPNYKYNGALNRAIKKGALFDARCFNIPKEEVCNLIYWRQIDASRNSIQMVGRAYFSHSELDEKSTSDIQDMLMEKYGINWNDYAIDEKRGSACYKTEIEKNGIIRRKWIIDREMPILKNEDRNYVEKWILI